ncbi:hypothetical protein AAMO2058_001547000 [Amorphochlora amoebiformis]
MDGTLVSSTSLAHEASNAVLQKFGFRTISREEYGQGTKFTTPVRLAWHAGIKDDDKAQAMGDAFDSSIIDLVTADNVPMFQGMRQLIAGLLKLDIKIAILSNASGGYVRRVAQKHGMSSMFRIQWGADDALRPKPHPDGLLSILERLKGENKKEVLMDSGAFDIVFSQVSQLDQFLLAAHRNK